MNISGLRVHVLFVFVTALSSMKTFDFQE